MTSTVNDPASAGSSPLKQRTKEEKAAYMREWRRRNPRRDKNIVLKSVYGITLDQYEAMLQEQGGGCKICSKPCPTGRSLSVDHDHKTGEVRGLLCGKCNTAIGMLRDDPTLLAKAQAYLSSQLA